MEAAGYLYDDINQFEIPVTATTVIGSNPVKDPEAAAGYAGMITIDDPSLAEIQVRIKISASSVTAEDVAGGGSWVTAPGQAPTPLPSIARTLNEGDIIHIGPQSYTFHLHPHSQSI
jgi:hypothetical protein